MLVFAMYALRLSNFSTLRNWHLKEQLYTPITDLRKFVLLLNDVQQNGYGGVAGGWPLVQVNECIGFLSPFSSSVC